MLEFFEGSLAAQQRACFLEEICHAGLFSWDFRSGEFRCSDGFFILLGIPANRQPSWSLLNDLTHPEDRVSEVALQEHLVRGGQFSRTLRIVRPDGRQRWLSAHQEVILDALGAPSKLIGALTDVTDFHQQKQMLELRQRRFRSAMAGVAPIVWSADAAGMTSYVAGWDDVTGRPDHTAHGMAWLDALHAEDRDRARRTWGRSIETGAPYECEYRILGPENNQLWVRSIAAPVLVDRVVQGWSGLVVNVTSEQSSGRNVAPTGAQIRAARALLRWSVAELAQRTNLTPAVIRRLEDTEGLVAKDAPVARTIGKVMASAGVDFVFHPNAPPGVRPAHG